MGKTIHFIGCCGVSMKTLMALTEKNGFKVTGSDLSLGGHDPKNVEGADLVVYSAAVTENNVEMLRARELKIPVVPRGEMLAEIMSHYKQTVAVAGTHGKTTTTGMLWESSLALDPTIHIGGTYNKKTGRIGGEDLFITEACEYKRSFLNLFPDIAVILNIDLDHTDCYADIDEMRDSFLRFASGCKKAVIISGDGLKKEDFEAALNINVPRNISAPKKGERCPKSAQEYIPPQKKVITVGLDSKNDYYATCLSCDKYARFSFCAHHAGKKLGRVTLSVAGRHNILNALFTLAACDELGLTFGKIAEGLYRFTGAERRMEFLGSKEGCAVFSDYAHHPKEIAAGILSARESKYRHITAVFEPHTYSRTKSFCAEFAEVLSKSDKIILLPVYAAREKPIEGISTAIIAKELQNMGIKPELFENYDSCAEYLSQNIVDDGVILFMGAGTIDTLARDFVGRG